MLEFADWTTQWKKNSNKILRICFSMCRRTPLAKHWNISENYVSIPHRKRRRGEQGQSVRIQQKENQPDNLR